MQILHQEKFILPVGELVGAHICGWKAEEESGGGEGGSLGAEVEAAERSQ